MVVRVVDRGPGIPERDLGRIFEAFYRGADDPTHPGAGLGLAIVKGFVEANGGSVSVESLPGTGDDLRGRVPARERKRGRAIRAARAGSRGTMSQRILVCDDEMQIRRALRVVLKDAGFEVVETADAEEALDAASVKPPDAAIIDLVLPDGDGVEVCRSIRAWSEMPILVLSARGRGGAEGPRARGRSRRLRDQAVRAARAGRPAQGGRCAEPARTRTSRRSGRTAWRSISPPTRSAASGEEVHLTPIEFRLLGTLARNRGRLMTHRALLKEVWGPGWEEDTQTLRTHIANLRRKIEPPDGPRYIRTDPGIGYRFERLNFTRS